MKTTGIVRQLDQLGRVVIPIELRRALGIEIHDPVDISIEDEKVIIRKYKPGCVFCGDMDAIPFKGKLICRNCLQALKD